MFGWEFPPLHTGGLGVACEGLVRGLRKNGVNVTLVLPHRTTADGVDVRVPDGMDVVAVESMLQAYDDHDSFDVRLSAGIPGDINLYGPDLGAAVERYTAQSVTLTRDVRPDVVHCHDWMTYAAGVCAAKHHDAPLVAHIHATELDRTDFHPHPWIAARERAGLLAANSVIAVSNYTKSLLVEHYGIPDRKITVVHNGHDPKVAPLVAQHGKKRGPLILFLGRLTVQKNPSQFLDVARLVRAMRPDVRFVMAGEGPMLGELMRRACALGLDNAVTFTGRVSKEEAEALFRQADCFVMPSLSEPFGLVALEAIGHGVPVILSKQSGASEVIEHAFKVDFWDADKMADCILTILREQPLARQLRSEAPRILQRLSWQRQAGAVRSLYEHLLRI
ncbi:MAG: 4-alpha-glucanotransferase [Candidatus Peregrinibacteria bacterium Gr01-1014_25]|nr:MAG: 4-alpha-glucanotransferase [Candidatus Peregrinibacteria bacterium Gr01-1014_25]